MERRVRGAFATPQGLRAWNEWFVAQGVPLTEVARRSEGDGDPLAESTLRRIRRGERTDHIARFFGLAGIAPTEGIHFQPSLPTARGVEGATEGSAAERFEALTADEADAAVALAAFSGGWTLESGPAVISEARWAYHDGLLKKGIVRARKGRFDLAKAFVPVIERIARRRRADLRGGEPHARFFLDRTLALAPDLRGEISREASEWFSEERENVLRALRHLWGTDPEAAKTLTEAFGALCFRAELHEEGIAALEPILTGWRDPDDARYVRCLGHRAKYAYRTLDVRTGGAHFRRALRAAERIGEPITQVECQAFLGSLTNMRFGMTRARPVYDARVQKAIRLTEEHRLSPYHRALMSFRLAISAYDGERWDATLGHARRSLDLALEAGSVEATAIASTLIAEIEYRRGSFEDAIPPMIAAIRACERHGDALRLFWAVKNLGEAHLDSGDARNALAHLRRARTLAYRVQNVYYTVYTGLLMALACALSAQREEAERFFCATLQETSPSSYVPVNEERYLLLGALVMLASDGRVRGEAFVALRRSSAGQPIIPATRRREQIRVAAGIEVGAHEHSISLFDRIGTKTLLEQGGWLEGDAYGMLLDLAS